MKSEKLTPFKRLLVPKIRGVLDALALDVNDPSIRDTPERMAKMYVNELFSGLYTDPPKLTDFDNPEYDQMVISKNIRLVSTCEHHFLPFIGRAHIGYIPDKRVVGISKLSRVVDWWARRPQIQERLTHQIAEFLLEKLEPKGVIVVLEAQHMCMTVRGVKEDQSAMVTSAIRGVFEEAAARNEFLRLIGK